ncbi:hypothetical protein MGWOODY_Smn3703 [hydrothermal vent metagenome]|uniref:Uncharacterized protein n=1 Tax=hydrothermal vent metagenome TaxID=652676 RepID=A0A160THL0_9ZZZZ
MDGDGSWIVVADAATARDYFSDTTIRRNVPGFASGRDLPLASFVQRRSAVELKARWLFGSIVTVLA